MITETLLERGVDLWIEHDGRLGVLPPEDMLPADVEALLALARAHKEALLQELQEKMRPAHAPGDVLFEGDKDDPLRAPVAGPELVEVSRFVYPAGFEVELVHRRYRKWPRAGLAVGWRWWPGMGPVLYDAFDAALQWEKELARAAALLLPEPSSPSPPGHATH